MPYEPPEQVIQGTGFRLEFEADVGGIVLTLAARLAHHKKALLEDLSEAFYGLPLNHETQVRMGEFVEDWLARHAPPG